MNERRFIRNLPVITLRAFIHLLIPAGFFVLLGVNNPQLFVASRTLGITLSTFCVVWMALLRIYGGYQIGKRKTKPIIYNMSIATLLTDLVAYVQLEIMNFNDQKNDTLVLFGEDMLLLCMALCVQVILIVLFANFGNHVYFKHHPPLKTHVIVSSREEYDKLLPRLQRFRLQFCVQGYALYNQPNVRDLIRSSEALFLYNVPIREKAELVSYCYKHRREVYYDMGLYDIVTRGSVVYNLGDMLFNEHSRKGLSLPQSFAKRLLDIVGSLIGIILAALPMLACAISIKLCDHGAVFFRQERRSMNGKVFKIIKFRTMHEHADEEPQVSEQETDARVTPVGRRMRRMRLDELPQLFNVLRGDMSLVGPRPEMLENIDKYKSVLPEFQFRERVKAGMTGYAQISGKYSTLPREKLLMDIFYIEQFSLWLDVKLILRTLIVILTPESAEAFKRETMAALSGTESIEL